MKNNSNKRKKKVRKMRAEYDFSRGARQTRRRISAGTYRYRPQKGWHDEPDVREYFPDAESVNNALRTLVSIAPKTRKKISKARSGYKRTSQNTPQRRLGHFHHQAGIQRKG